MMKVIPAVCVNVLMISTSEIRIAALVPIVHDGERVEAGSVMADGPAIQNGDLARVRHRNPRSGVASPRTSSQTGGITGILGELDRAGKLHTNVHSTGASCESTNPTYCVCMPSD